ncbi:MAG: indole-3-glycerol phosphate synthase TrpC [Rhodospirillaceae bacterium]|jgi:indole-3-glycerol phosphate synthase|nr:indole-3-glycerol phosphate synthase TrpC [Rhodospirillaceae bacterium]
MNNILTTICSNKKQYLERAKLLHSISELHDLAKTQSAPRGFATSLNLAAKTGYGLIAEIKKASPGAGLICQDFDPISLAKSYVSGGAACLSVLTENLYFHGRNEDLVSVRKSVSLPILRKDFIIDEWQIEESRAIGADCILLIMSCLSDNQAIDFEDQAQNHSMDVIIEIHDEKELERAMLLSSPLIGINNRNLKTMTTDISTTEYLATKIPNDRIILCESGIKTSKDIIRISKIGIRRFLVGESLMRASDVTAATRSLLNNE